MEDFDWPTRNERKINRNDWNIATTIGESNDDEESHIQQFAAVYIERYWPVSNFVFIPAV